METATRNKAAASRLHRQGYVLYDGCILLGVVGPLEAGPVAINMRRRLVILTWTACVVGGCMSLSIHTVIKPSTQRLDNVIKSSTN
jgi:hypothetical protein